MDEKNYIAIKEAEQLTGKSDRTIRNLVINKEIEYIEVGDKKKTYKIHKEQLRHKYPFIQWSDSKTDNKNDNNSKTDNNDSRTDNKDIDIQPLIDRILNSQNEISRYQKLLTDWGVKFKETEKSFEKKIIRYKLLIIILIIILFFYILITENILVVNI